MSVHKVIEIMAESDKSWKEAAQNAVKEAAKTVKNIKSVWVKDQSATVKNGEIDSYRVHCRITFEIND
jgi:hypothetical protein